MTPNVPLIYKLLELENARKTLDQGLRVFTNRVCLNKQKTHKQKKIILDYILSQICRLHGE